MYTHWGVRRSTYSFLLYAHPYVHVDSLWKWCTTLRRFTYELGAFWSVTYYLGLVRGVAHVSETHPWCPWKVFLNTNLTHVHSSHTKLPNSAPGSSLSAGLQFKVQHKHSFTSIIINLHVNNTNKIMNSLPLDVVIKEENAQASSRSLYLPAIDSNWLISQWWARVRIATTQHCVKLDLDMGNPRGSTCHWLQFDLDMGNPRDSTCHWLKYYPTPECFLNSKRGHFNFFIFSMGKYFRPKLTFSEILC